MGTFREFTEKLQGDQEFSNSVNEAIIARIESEGIDRTDISKAVISVAEEFGYSVTEEELNAYIEQNRAQMEELHEEEMGKVSGGTGLFPITIITATAVMAITVEIKDRFIDKK